MNLKLDENLGIKAQSIFREAGHDADTIVAEGLSGASDQKIYNACCKENRALVTLDLDFADPIRFLPQKCGGIVILRTRGRMTSSVLELLVRQCLQGLDSIPLENDLWIVEPSRIRIHHAEKD